MDLSTLGTSTPPPSLLEINTPGTPIIAEVVDASAEEQGTSGDIGETPTPTPASNDTDDTDNNGTDTLSEEAFINRVFALSKGQAEAFIERLRKFKVGYNIVQ